MPMERTGRCLCGAISYTAKADAPRLSACHCDMCRRWCGVAITAAEVRVMFGMG